MQSNTYRYISYSFIDESKVTNVVSFQYAIKYQFVIHGPYKSLGWWHSGKDVAYPIFCLLLTRDGIPGHIVVRVAYLHKHYPTCILSAVLLYINIEPCCEEEIWLLFSTVQPPLSWCSHSPPHSSHLMHSDCLLVVYWLAGDGGCAWPWSASAWWYDCPWSFVCIEWLLLGICLSRRMYVCIKGRFLFKRLCLCKRACIPASQTTTFHMRNVAISWVFLANLYHQYL